MKYIPFIILVFVLGGVLGVHALTAPSGNAHPPIYLGGNAVKDGSLWIRGDLILEKLSSGVSPELCFFREGSFECISSWLTKTESSGRGDFDWAYSEWTECNKSCGEGKQYRSIWCERSDGGVFSDAECSGKVKENDNQSCYIRDCFPDEVSKCLGPRASDFGTIFYCE